MMIRSGISLAILQSGRDRFERFTRFPTLLVLFVSIHRSCVSCGGHLHEWSSKMLFNTSPWAFIAGKLVRSLTAPPIIERLGGNT